MEIKELIRICVIGLEDDGKLHAHSKETEKHIDEIKAKKQEIIAYIKKEEAEKAEIKKAREEKINAIEGLKKIKAAIEAEERYEYLFNKMMTNMDNDGANPPSKPEVSSAELKARYPRAAAYVKAEAWSYTDHYKKSSVGRTALDRIIEGEDYQKVIAEMEKEWSDYCDERAMD